MGKINGEEDAVKQLGVEGKKNEGNDLEREGVNNWTGGSSIGAWDWGNQKRERERRGIFYKKGEWRLGKGRLDLE